VWAKAYLFPLFSIAFLSSLFPLYTPDVYIFGAAIFMLLFYFVLSLLGLFKNREDNIDTGYVKLVKIIKFLLYMMTLASFIFLTLRFIKNVEIAPTIIGRILILAVILAANSILMVIFIIIALGVTSAIKDHLMWQTVWADRHTTKKNLRKEGKSLQMVEADKWPDFWNNLMIHGKVDENN